MLCHCSSFQSLIGFRQWRNGTTSCQWNVDSSWRWSKVSQNELYTWTSSFYLVFQDLLVQCNTKGTLFFAPPSCLFFESTGVAKLRHSNAAAWVDNAGSIHWGIWMSLTSQAQKIQTIWLEGQCWELIHGNKMPMANENKVPLEVTLAGWPFCYEMHLHMLCKHWMFAKLKSNIPPLPFKMRSLLYWPR